MGAFLMVVFNTSLVVGLGIAAAAVLLRICRKGYSAACRKRIWTFLACCLLIPFSLFRFPGAHVAKIPNPVLREADDQAAGGLGTAGGEAGSTQELVPGQAAWEGDSGNPSFRNPGRGKAGSELTAADAAFLLWACVGVLLAAYLVAGYGRMRARIRRWSSTCEDGRVQEVVVEAAAEHKLKRIPEVRIAKDSAEGPFTTGVRKSVIVLPEDAALREKDLRFILKHEVVHCRNHDVAWKLFFLAVNVIHWFNPLVWYLRRAMEQDVEVACDEEVVARASREKRKEYSAVILSYVERSRYRGSAVSTGYGRGVGFLKRRFDSIFNGGKKKNGILLAGGVCTLALLLCCAFRLQGGGMDVDFDKCSVVYHRNNAETDARPRSGRIAGDWNGDGAEDVLTVDVVEREGSEFIEKLELNVSGSDVPYVIRDQDHDFLDLIPGNFDSDEDTEILLVFDMRYAGANGTIGIQLLDFNGSEYVNVFAGSAYGNVEDGFFAGYDYSVDVRAGENESCLISRMGGGEMNVPKDGVSEFALGMVTGSYYLDVLEKDDVNYIRIKQYVAGEYKTDHVGDVVCTFGMADGGLKLLEEKLELPDVGDGTPDGSAQGGPARLQAVSQGAVSFFEKTY